MTGTNPSNHDVECVADERELHEGEVAEQVDESRSARARPTLDIEDTQRFPERHVVSRFEVERWRLAPAPNLDRVLFGQAVGRRLVRHVRGPGEQIGQLGLDLLELRLELLHLRGDPRHLADQPLLLLALGAADRLARPVLLGAQLLHPAGELTPSLVQGEDLVDRVREVASGESLAEPIWILTDRPNVEHPRPWPPRPRSWRPSRGRRPSAARPEPVAGP